MAGVAFLVVYREGAETVLFYNALMIGGGADIIPPVAFGFTTGLVVLGAVLWVVRAFGVRIPLRPFFVTTGALLYLMAFVFLGNGLRELQEGGVLPITPIESAPFVNALGVYPTAETLGGQAILLVLLLIACWISFAAPRLSARRERSEPVAAPEQRTTRS
jgi:high-affinity iron transporter